jgi:hypothetical protein
MADMVWNVFDWVEFGSFSVWGENGVVPVPLFCWLLEKGEPEPKPVAGWVVPPKAELDVDPPKRLLPVLAPKAGLELDPKAEFEAAPKPPVDAPPKPPKVLLDVAVPPPKRLGELVAAPNAGLVWPKGEELLVLAPKPGLISVGTTKRYRNVSILIGWRGIQQKRVDLPPPKPVLALEELPNRLLPPAFPEPKAELLFVFEAKPEVAVEPKPPKAEVVWFWLEPKPEPPKPPKPDMVEMGRATTR